MIRDVLTILVEGAIAVLVAMGGNTIKLLAPRASCLPGTWYLVLENLPRID